MGLGIGPLTDNQSDKSGLRIITAIEYIELIKKAITENIFWPPPGNNKEMVIKAGLIAKESVIQGLLIINQLFILFL